MPKEALPINPIDPSSPKTKGCLRNEDEGETRELLSRRGLDVSQEPKNTYMAYMDNSLE